MDATVQDVLLDEAAGGSVIEELAIEDLIAALGGHRDEPVDDSQCACLVVIAAGAHPPHRDVITLQPINRGLIAVDDRGEQPVGRVDDDLSSSNGHGRLLFAVVSGMGNR